MLRKKDTKKHILYQKTGKYVTTAKPKTCQTSKSSNVRTTKSENRSSILSKTTHNAIVDILTEIMPYTNTHKMTLVLKHYSGQVHGRPEYNLYYGQPITVDLAVQEFIAPSSSLCLRYDFYHICRILLQIKSF